MSLRAAPPRPTLHRVAPAYPRMLAVGAILLAGCGGVVQKDASTFVLSAARMPLDMDYLAHSEAFHEDLPVGSITLTHAPEAVAAAIASI